MRRLFCVVTLALVAGACVVARAAGTPGSVSFKADVQPILDENCVACHQSGSPAQGLALEDGKSWKALVRAPSRESKLMLVAPGDPDGSYVVHKLEGTQGHLGAGAQMPLGDPISPAKVAIIRHWIASGAPQN